MSIAIISHASGVGSCVLNSVGANLLAVAVCDYQQSAAGTVTDSVGGNNNGTFSSLTSQSVFFDNRVQWFYVQPTHTGATHTFTASGGGRVVAFAISGAAASPFDVESGLSDGNSAHTTIQPGSITPTSDGALILTVLGTTNGAISTTPTIDAGFDSPATEFIDGNFSTGFGIAASYLIQGSAAAVNPTWTHGATYAATAIAAFKAATGTPPDAPTWGTPSFASITTDGADISFNDDGGADETFTLQIDDDDTFPSPRSYSVASGDTTLDFGEPLADDTTYYARIRASNASGNSDWSETATFATPEATPALTSPVPTATTTKSSATVTWSSATGGTAPYTYNVRVGTMDEGEILWDVYPLAGGDATSPYTVPGLAYGRNYYFQIATTDADDTTAITDGTPLKQSTPPRSLLNVDGTVTLRFNPGGNTEGGISTAGDLEDLSIQIDAHAVIHESTAQDGNTITVTPADGFPAIAGSAVTYNPGGVAQLLDAEGVEYTTFTGSIQAQAATGDVSPLKASISSTLSFTLSRPLSGFYSTDSNLN